MIRIALRATALAFLLLASAWADEAAVARRTTELRDVPSDSGRTLAVLPEHSPLTRLEPHQGPWVQVRTVQGTTGWVHLFDLGPASTPAATGSGSGLVGSALRGVGTLFGGGAAKPATTSTTAGIRGLDAEDLAQAQPDPAAVKRMESLRASDGDVRAFAERAAWKPVAVSPLAAPAASRSAEPARNPNQQEMP
jgi:hypothetical protein